MALTLKTSITATETTVDVLGTDAIEDGDVFEIGSEYVEIQGDPGEPARPRGVAYFRRTNLRRGVQGTAEAAHAAGAGLTQKLPGDGGGTSDHGDLTGREAADSHPASAITDLTLAAVLLGGNDTGGLPIVSEPGVNQPASVARTAVATGTGDADASTGATADANVANASVTATSNSDGAQANATATVVAGSGTASASRAASADSGTADVTTIAQSTSGNADASTTAATGGAGTADARSTATAAGGTASIGPIADATSARNEAVGDILPATDNVHSLGSDALRWIFLFLKTQLNVGDATGPKSQVPRFGFENFDENLVQRVGLYRDGFYIADDTELRRIEYDASTNTLSLRGSEGDQTTEYAIDRVVIQGSTGVVRYQVDGSTADLTVLMPDLPTSDPVEAGRVWNDSGTLKVSAGA